jgi:5,5'-dehydrodivanillate O-demethylase
MAANSGSVGAGSKANGRKSNRWVDFASAGPDTPGGIYLRKFWQPVALSEELKSGTARPIHLMGEKYTLYRGEGGAAHIVGYRCAHRSTQLSTGWVRDDCIQCMYHGWKYDADGACVERPGEDPSGPAPHASIPAFPTREHLGLIYGYFGADEPPVFPPFEGYRDIGVIENHVLDFPANWFQTMENHFDETHIAFVHSFGGSHDALGRSTYELPEIYVYETDFGMVRETTVPGRDTRVTLYLMPNIMRILIPTFSDLNEIGGWRDTYIILVPTNDENHRVYFTQNVHIAESEKSAFEAMHTDFRARVAKYPPITELTQEILTGKSHITDHLDHPYLLLLEDAITQAGQGQIVDRNLELLGRTDSGVAAMRRVFDREMRAAAAGHPTKQWNYQGQEPVLGH